MCFQEAIYPLSAAEKWPVFPALRDAVVADLVGVLHHHQEAMAMVSTNRVRASNNSASSKVPTRVSGSDDSDSSRRRFKSSASDTVPTEAENLIEAVLLLNAIFKTDQEIAEKMLIVVEDVRHIVKNKTLPKRQLPIAWESAE